MIPPSTQSLGVSSSGLQPFFPPYRGQNEIETVDENIPDSDNEDEVSQSHEKIKNKVQSEKLVTKHHTKQYTSSEITQLARKLSSNRQTFGAKPSNGKRAESPEYSEETHAAKEGFEQTFGEQNTAQKIETESSISLTNAGAGNHSMFNVPPFPDITSTEKKLSSDYLERILKRESLSPEVAQMMRFV